MTDRILLLISSTKVGNLEKLSLTNAHATLSITVWTSFRHSWAGSLNLSISGMI